MIFPFIFLFFGYLFYKLAKKYNKNPWMWTIIGSFSYLIIQFIVGIVFRFIKKTVLLSHLNGTILMDIIEIFIASLIIYFLYRFLNNKWKNKDSQLTKNQIDQIGDYNNSNL